MMQFRKPLLEQNQLQNVGSWKVTHESSYSALRTLLLNAACVFSFLKRFRNNVEDVVLVSSFPWEPQSWPSINARIAVAWLLSLLLWLHHHEEEAFPLQRHNRLR